MLQEVEELVSSNRRRTASLAVVALPAAVWCGAASAETPAPPPAAAPATAPVLVSIDAGGGQARAGGTLDYTVRVRNESDRPIAAAEVYQMLPATLQAGSVGEGGRIDATQVTWTAELPPRREVTLTLTTKVGERTTGGDKVVTTACVRTDPGQPLAGCASSQVAWAPEDGGRGGAAPSRLPMMAGAAAAVAVAGGVFLLRGRRRRRRSDPVTESG
ncbi:hypothetical protein ACWCYY_31670 [Kitasatospora sp. NPDC001664]